MTEIEFLSWVRGTGFQIASAIFVFGVIVRLLGILMLGRKANLAEANGSEMAGGLRTVATRFIPKTDSMQRSRFTIIAGYIFHIGLFITIFLFAPHILFFKDVTGLSWPSLPTQIVDAVTVVTMIALVAVLVRRWKDPLLRYLTNAQDYLVWAVTILPLITGYLAFHRLGMPAPTLLALHILSVELLMVVFPFTKLMHTFTFVLSRWYNGAISGYKGVQS
jgi:nitrate reductase gamma subunit